MFQSSFACLILIMGRTVDDRMDGNLVNMDKNKVETSEKWNTWLFFRNKTTKKVDQNETSMY